MTRRVRDELVKQGDLATFWRQFWAHCDLRPEECTTPSLPLYHRLGRVGLTAPCLADHPAYVRVDYDDPAVDTGEDMEDGEIPETHMHTPQQQQPLQVNKHVPSTPTGVLGGSIGA